MTTARADSIRDRSDGAERRLHVIQGAYNVSADPDVLMTTLLGSCVAACLRDPVAGIGGMNHFLLPGRDDGEAPRECETYAVHLMELLVNELLRRGARRDRLEGKLFGGARTIDGTADIGARNASFAGRFLKHEGIRLIGGSLGGDLGRRIQFWPVSGRARQVFLAAGQTPPPAVQPARPALGGAVEFF